MLNHPEEGRATDVMEKRERVTRKRDWAQGEDTLSPEGSQWVLNTISGSLLALGPEPPCSLLPIHRVFCTQGQGKDPCLTKKGEVEGLAILG